MLISTNRAGTPTPARSSSPIAILQIELFYNEISFPIR